MTTEQTFVRHMERLDTAVALGEPDRVPFAPQTGDFIGTAYGLSQYDMMKDMRNVIPCMKQYLTQFQPDLVWPVFGYSIDLCELLGAGFIRLPGPSHGLPLNSSFQVLDNTYLEDDEFDEYLMDPTHFMLTKVLPRKYKALEPLSKLNFREIVDLKMMTEFGTLAQPDVKAAMEALMQGGQLMMRQMQHSRAVSECIKGMGCISIGGATHAPFDIYADCLRGLIQAVMDVKMYPDEVLAVTERIEQMSVDRFIAGVKARGERFVFMPLHAASDEFMSGEDYATFYWPGLKRTIEKLVAAGLTPLVFCEGKYNTRLEFLKDVPRGKVIYMFEQVDIV
ncbi:MAG: hypothetical protein ACI4O5_02245, partial [Oscillospiraceae bacterium]